MSQQLRIYDVLSIRFPGTRRTPAENGGAHAKKADPVLSYFDWLVSGPVGPREKAWAQHAHGRLA